MNVKRKATSSLTASVTSPTNKRLKQDSLAAFFGAPKVSKDIHTAPKISFDKSTWIKTLTPAQKELLKLEIDTLHESWLAVLKDEVTKPYFLKLKEFLKNEMKAFTIYPPEKEIYSWSQHTHLDRVKVVILGQDPYHNANQAHGLCFSVRPPTYPPPSLKNIYKCLKNDYPDFTEPRSGLLTPWADRGVLLLNACLTVRAHQANSHAGHGWETFTTEVLRAVSKSTRGVVFLAWGSPAQKRVDSLGLDKSKHLVLRSVHPSPLSASKGFFECKHFIKTNDWLRTRYGVEGEVEWDCLAEGKQGRGLRPKALPSGDESIVPQKWLNGNETSKSLRSISKGRFEDDEGNAFGDTEEFDEEDLAKIP